MPITAKKPAPSWRDVLKIHPAAELFPLMTKAQLRELANDIKQNGLRLPCSIIESGRGKRVLIDGRNRLDALELLGDDERLHLDNSIVFEELPADTDVYARVISVNIHRRHLTGEQKRELIAKLIKTQPGKSDRQIAATAKANHKTVGAVRAEQEARGEIPHVETRTDTKGRAQPVTRKKATDPPVQVSEEVLRKREEATERIRAFMGQPARADIGAASSGEAEGEEAKATRAAHGQPADDEPPSKSEWKPKCLAHLPVATRLEMLVGLLEDGLTPIKNLVEALRLPANASVKRQGQLEGLQAMAGVIFNWMNVVKDEVEEIRRVLVAFEQRDRDETHAAANTEAADTAPPAADGLDIPPTLRRATS
jgi:ParB-like chromosome segregation protein Spo0J